MTQTDVQPLGLGAYAHRPRHGLGHQTLVHFDLTGLGIQPKNVDLAAFAARNVNNASNHCKPPRAIGNNRTMRTFAPEIGER